MYAYLQTKTRGWLELLVFLAGSTRPKISDCRFIRCHLNLSKLSNRMRCLVTSDTLNVNIKTSTNFYVSLQLYRLQFVINLGAVELLNHGTCRNMRPPR